MAALPEALSIGKYRFLVELGSGGMGDVFLAVAQGPKGFNKLQVIKRLRPELAQDPEFLGMFLNEARIAARLNHPNVVQTNEVHEDGTEYFIAMEYLEGQSLYAITKRAIASTPKKAPPQRMPLAHHLHVLAEACEGLHYAHELQDYDGTPLNLVHRDCSPQNVFVTYEGEVKILDFGIAKAADSATITRTGVLKGKVPYMAPEQLDGRAIDRRADIFAVGAMLWEAATGTRLWKGLNDIQIAHRLHQKDIPAPSSFEPSVDPALEAIVMKALAYRPADRYSTAAELQAVLDGYVAKLGGVRRRELGKYVSGLFTDTRRSLRQKIEDELRDVLPSWRTLLSTGSGEIVTGGSGQHSAMTDEQALAASGEQSARPTKIEGPNARGGTPVSHVSRPAEPLTPLEAVMPQNPPPELMTQASTSLTVMPEQKPRSRAFLLVAAATVVLVALVVLVLRGRKPEENESTPNVASPKPTPAATEQTAVVKPSNEPIDLNTPEEKPDAASSAKKIGPTPTGTAKHPVGPGPTASTTTKPGKPPLDPGDPWQ
jgi:serine/threonine protein kinase